MPWYPDAIKRPIPRYQTGELRIPINPHRIVGHTAVTSAASMFGFFNVSGRPTPHGYFNEDGEFEQYIDTDFRATACLDGNHDCIAYESWDGGPTKFHGTDGPAWTDAQVEAIAQFHVWCHQEHGIPLLRLTSSKPGTQGVGWHRLGIDGNFPQPDGHLLGGRVDGGEVWTDSPGKVCPGDTKIQGIVNLILPRAIQIESGDDDMQFSDKIPGTDQTVGDALRTIKQIQDALATFRQNEVDRDTAEADRDAAEGRALGLILDAIKAIPTGPGGTLTKDEVTAACEQATRNVLGSLNDGGKQ